jgi:hypothetical protein
MQYRRLSEPVDVGQELGDLDETQKQVAEVRADLAI